jgi:hypothetical protein
MNNDCSSIYAVSVLSVLAARYHGMKCSKTPVPVSLFPSSHLRELNPTIIVLSGSRQRFNNMMSDSASAVVFLYSTSNSLAQLGQLEELSYGILPP